jgi:hypothetical protein
LILTVHIVIFIASSLSSFRPHLRYLYIIPSPAFFAGPEPNKPVAGGDKASRNSSFVYDNTDSM